ncbi:TIGR03915 family putative DNA repair protein [Polaromonas sp.]|uniref:TIGR03915 family putative DNA repair protein n=1 Tax=Polaromonas sp. TaxID=1869339 RepID=UPI003264A29B
MGMMSDPLTNDLFPQALAPVTLRGPADLEGFRRAARGLLAQNILPAQVSWHCGDTPAHELPALPPESPAAGDAPAVPVPPEFVALCESAILHSQPGRFELLYRLLWRLVHEPGLRHNPLDGDMAEAQRLAQEVQRDMHKMKAFVRFRSVQDDTFRNHPEGGPLHVAWFEPEHTIVEAIALLFASRFSQMRWALLTPQTSARWDGASLHFAPGASREDAPSPDAGEQRWLAFYQRTFQLARQAVPALHKGMPRKYRRKLPGAERMHPAVSAAHQRGSRLASQPARRLPQGRAELAVPARTAETQVQLSFDGLHEAGAASEEREAGWANQLTGLGLAA